MLNLVAEQILNGISYGLLLFLIAAGLSLTFGVMHLINLAHGSIYMLGAFVLALVTKFTGSFFIGVLIGVFASFVAGLVLERLIIRRLYSRPHLHQVLATFGIILFFNDALRWISGGVPMFVRLPEWLSGSITILGGFQYPIYRLVITGVSLLVALGLWWVIAKSKSGMLVRAAASDPGMLRRIGWDVPLISALVFAVGSALAGLAGVLVGPVVSIEVGMGEQVLIIGFVIVVIGGMGSIRGTFIAALSVGMIDTIGRAFMPIILNSLFEARMVASLAPALSASLVYMLMAVVLVQRSRRGLLA